MDYNRWIILALSLSSVLNFHGSAGRKLGEAEEGLHHAYECLKGSGKVSVNCPVNQVILISRVMYGGQPPPGCGQTFTDDNNCQQLSQVLTDQAIQNCNRRRSCKVPVIPLSELRQDLESRILEVKNGCGVGGVRHETVYTNYVVVKFTCQEFTFCKEVPTIDLKDVLVKTEDFPLTTVTNPTCGCTFTNKAGSGEQYIQAYVQCNGTVHFMTEEMVPNPPSYEPEFIKVEKDYYCSDMMHPRFLKVGTKKTVSLRVGINVKNSSEHSAYSFKMIGTMPDRTSSLRGVFTRNLKAVIEVTCDEGSFYLPYTTSLIIYISVPLGAVLLIALTVLYCVLKKRRKRARAWRRRHVPLRHKTQKDGTIREEMVYGFSSPAGSPMASDKSSSPPSTRRKPEGKLDSDSDEDLTKVAAMLHKQNTQRKIDEAKKRELYYNASGAGSRPFMSHGQDYADYPDLDRFRSQTIKPTYGARRCMSNGNLRGQRAVVDVSDDDSDGPYPHPAQRASSTSIYHTNPRPVKRRASRPSPSQPPPSLYPENPPNEEQVYLTPRRHDEPVSYGGVDTGVPGGYYQSVNPTPTSRLGRSNSAAYSYQRNSMDAEQRCASIDNLQPSGAAHRNNERHKPHALRNSQSVSQSRTSLRSMKRRAPQPPGHPASNQPTPNTSRAPDHLPYGEQAPSQYDQAVNSVPASPLSLRSQTGYPSRSRSNTPSRTWADSPRSIRSNAERRVLPSPNPSLSRDYGESGGSTPSRSRPWSSTRSRNWTGSSISSRAATGSPLSNSSSNISSHTKNKPKPKYFNHYAVKIPIKPKPRVNGLTSGSSDSTNNNSPISGVGAGTSKHENRRYSDASLDNSDHEFEDLEQVGIIGDLDMGNTEEQW